MADKKDHLWDRENQTASPAPPAHPGPKITDTSLPIFMAPDPALAEYPRYIRLAEGEPKVRVETKAQETDLRANYAAKHKPAAKHDEKLKEEKPAAPAKKGTKHDDED